MDRELLAENARLRAHLLYGDLADDVVVKARKKGARDLKRLLAERGAEAEYEVIATVFLAPTGDRYGPRCFSPQFGWPAKPTTIKFDGAPSRALRPLNDAATAIFAAWQMSITYSPQMVGSL